MYLVDTNVWLERLLGQEQSAKVGQFLDQTPTLSAGGKRQEMF